MKKTLNQFAVWLTSDQTSGFIFAGDKLGERSLVYIIKMSNTQVEAGGL